MKTATDIAQATQYFRENPALLTSYMQEMHTILRDLSSEQMTGFLRVRRLLNRAVSDYIQFPSTSNSSHLIQQEGEFTQMCEDLGFSKPSLCHFYLALRHAANHPRRDVKGISKPRKVFRK